MFSRSLSTQHKTISQARARTQTARSGDERTSHEATAPSQKDKNCLIKNFKCQLRNDELLLDS